MFISFISSIFLLISLVDAAPSFSVFALAASQLIILTSEVYIGKLSGVGGFIFMYFLFFAVRPLYIILENDYDLFSRVFKTTIQQVDIISSMWWATLCLIIFFLGALFLRRSTTNKLNITTSIKKSSPQCAIRITTKQIIYLLFLQFILLIPIFILARSGRLNLYGTTYGAYLYDLPMLLQGFELISFIVIFNSWKQYKISIIYLLMSASLFVSFSWFMRNLSMFRGFYITGLLSGILSIILLSGKRFGYIFLIPLVVFLQPIFSLVGKNRALQNSSLIESLSSEMDFLDISSYIKSMWDYYNSMGDMNIFDSFVVQLQHQPSFQSYLWSWLYIPLHIIPRALWATKPHGGITQDLAYLNDAPVGPGIVGYFFADGGYSWMILCMFILGYLIAYLDYRLLKLSNQTLKSCLIAIYVVNSMFLTRFFLWQSFYQFIYTALPCFLALKFLRQTKQRALRKL